MGMVTVGGMEVADVVGGTGIGRIPYAPSKMQGRLRIAGDDLDPGRAEEGHREEARQLDIVRGKADMDREGFDQVLPVIAVVECACAKEEGDRGVYRRLR